jgi:hypothetical protein
LKLRNALSIVAETYRNLNWGEALYSVYAIPSCLGHVLKGEPKQTTYPLWTEEWRYADYASLKNDLASLLFELNKLFSNDGGTSHEQ